MGDTQFHWRLNGIADVDCGHLAPYRPYFIHLNPAFSAQFRKLQQLVNTLFTIR